MSITNNEDYECALDIIRLDGSHVYFDVQSAEPGAFVIPGVVDLEIVKQGDTVELAWIYFKGDPMAGSYPGHPFEMPFDNSYNKFSIDLVKDDEPSRVIRQIMPPTTSYPFWEGGAPFGTNGNHTMFIPQLGDSCKYRYVGIMMFRGIPAGDFETDTIFRVKLQSDMPPSSHLSGRLLVSSSGSTESILHKTSKLLQTQTLLDLDVIRSELPRLFHNSTISSSYTLYYAIGGIVMIFVLAYWAISGQLRKSKRISL